MCVQFTESKQELYKAYPTGGVCVYVRLPRDDSEEVILQQLHEID